MQDAILDNRVTYQLGNGKGFYWLSQYGWNGTVWSDYWVRMRFFYYAYIARFRSFAAKIEGSD
ncbi:hypothetical protein DSM106972_014580 [Dulcicalothrix desertica PCC 7102]|uniref:Uncharacterized protein n=1 Tax=Dulcicalothrix desertica PCC 7102 TaxID=232991 RepID=A0A3S1CQ27_9CYAN|nr:hypothetical protein DSM106972_014580 [Dulcicalothrix desertica PCC 7102]